MEIKIKRSIKGELLAITQHEQNSYFWKANLTECPRFEDIKMELEVTLMTSWWNKAFLERRLSVYWLKCLRSPERESRLRDITTK